MIQRIQSIYLGLAAICMAIVFSGTLAFAHLELPTGVMAQGAFRDGRFNASDHVLLLVLVMMALGLSLAAIFLYSNRALQLKISRFAFASVVLTLGVSVVLLYIECRHLDQDAKLSISYGYGVPLLAIVFLLLAIRGIRSDDRLVRSAGRLR